MGRHVYWHVQLPTVEMPSPGVRSGGGDGGGEGGGSGGGEGVYSEGRSGSGGTEGRCAAASTTAVTSSSSDRTIPLGAVWDWDIPRTEPRTAPRDGALARRHRHVQAQPLG